MLIRIVPLAHHNRISIVLKKFSHPVKQMWPPELHPSRDLAIFTERNTRFGKPHPKRKFTPDEDQTLRALVDELGTDDWQIIADRMPGRNMRQVRDRYENYLADNLSRDPWTPAEDMLLLEKLDEYGRMWRRIAQYFPERTDISVKSRYAQLTRKGRKYGFHDLKEMVVSSMMKPVAPIASDPRRTTDQQTSVTDIRPAVGGLGLDYDFNDSETWTMLVSNQDMCSLECAADLGL